MFSMTRWISSSDINEQLTLKPTSVINLLQDIEMLHIDSLKTFNQYLKENEIGVFLTYRQVDLFKDVSFGEVLKLYTFPHQTNPFFGFRNTLIYDENNQLVCASNSLGPFVSIKDGRPHKIPLHIIKTLDDQDKFEKMTYLSRKITYHQKEQKTFDPIIIQPSHIDRYHHVNNVYYIEFATNIIGQYSFNRIRAEYKKAFKIHDKVYPILYPQEEAMIVVLCNQAEEVYCIIEFSTMKLN